MNEDLIDWVHRSAPELAEDLGRLQRLLGILDQYQRERWHRHVSAGDTITDRWERAQRLGFGRGTSVYDNALILGDVQVGIDTWIGPNTVLDGSGGLDIGDHCSISTGVQIYSHDSVLWAVSGGVTPTEKSATRIGSNTYIGPNAIISMGVSVGSRCIVGAGSLVTQDVPDGTVAYGMPARRICSVEEYLARRTTPPESQGAEVEGGNRR